MLVPRLDPADPAAWERPLAPGPFGLRRYGGDVIVLALAYFSIAALDMGNGEWLCGLFGLLAMFPLGLWSERTTATRLVVSSSAAALLLRGGVVGCVAAVQPGRELPFSGWVEGYSPIVSDVASALVTFIASYATTAASSLAPRWINQVGSSRCVARVALMVAALLSTAALVSHVRRPNPSGYLASLPLDERTLPGVALVKGRLHHQERLASDALQATFRCRVRRDDGRGLIFVVERTVDPIGPGDRPTHDRWVFPLRAATLEAVPWSLSAHRRSVGVPLAYVVLAFGGLASTLPTVIARRRLASRWQHLGSFEDAFRRPGGIIVESHEADTTPVAVLFAEDAAGPPMRTSARRTVIEVIPGTVSALRERVALRERWMDLGIVGRLLVTHVPLVALGANGFLWS